ncbi:enoyl-CoA hydratase [Stappia sp. GBMRC 2046]|uniref:Enoyl-CoA hydratase n=1 Tax=Stappia sediminis TaxID=2692190 RepID=A0A7X3LRM4_9HYPH|nr:enoyl-CoA hydratase [Stappia sediminis]MXN63820.1 enoyl-CoA hydratase [Stappia sediminis]
MPPSDTPSKPERDQGRITTAVKGPIGWITIDNPSRRNAVTLAMWQAIPKALAGLAGDEAVRVVVLKGAGDETFVAGADISEFETVRKDAASARAYEDSNAAAFSALRECPKPTVAMIRGFCLGGGLGLAAACDIRIAEAGSRFGIPAGKLGVGYPPKAVRDIVKLIGPARAKLLFYTAARIGSEEALRIGLIDREVAAGALEIEIAEFLQAIAGHAPLTLKAAKAAIDAVTGDPEEADWDMVQAMADACFDSADFAEGRSAFLEKRAPRFSGR